MATLHDLAETLGLSVSTVSRALNGYPHIDERTRQRVFAAAKQLNYQPNALARALRRNQTKAVGLIIPDILNHFYAASATVLQTTLEQHGYRLIVCISNSDPERDRGCLEALLEERADGIVHVPCTPNGARLVRELGSSVPVVELNRHTDTGLFDAVVSDDYTGALELTRYLLHLGHRRIAMIAGDAALSTTRARVAGFQQAFQEAELALDPALIRYGNYSATWGAQAVHTLMVESPSPTAIFASGNQLVLGALQAINDLDIQVPQQLSLIGFDDPDWFAVWRPPITTYALPLREMGLLAAQLLLDRMTARKSDTTMPTITRLSGRLVVRRSCTPYDVMATTH
jgi:LacI family transcriptional regulator